MVARAASRLRSLNGVKVFCATKYQDRACLGETVTRRLAEHTELTLVDLVHNRATRRFTA
jgi:hypothetical protein